MEFADWFRLISGIVIGIVIGVVVATMFVFPPNLIEMKIVEITIGDILRIGGGVFVILIGAIGGVIVARESQFW